jgi:bifunctional DNase/RNase
MDKKRMLIKDIQRAKINDFYDLMLVEDDGNRALNISIGENEAKNIAIFLDSTQPSRPLTYDMFFNILKSFNIKINEIIITKFIDGTYFANLIVSKNDSDVIIVDCRPSDAINLALRSNCPIFATEKILDDVGFDCKKYLNDMIKEEKQPNNSLLNSIGDMSIWGMNMLEDLLKDAIDKEDYQVASILRDKIKELKEKEQ